MKDMLGLLAAAALVEPTAPVRKRRKHVRTGMVLPAKDYKRRQARARMQKQSRKKNRTVS